MKAAPFVVLYLAAIVAANLSVEHFGPRAAIYNSFLLIGLDLTTRDRLHDVWRRRRWLKMGALIAAGSALTVLVSGARRRTPTDPHLTAGRLTSPPPSE